MKGFAAFGHTLGETAVPPGSAAIAKRLITETAGSEQYYREMTVATSFTGIEDEATAAEKVGGQFDSDYQGSLISDRSAMSLRRWAIRPRRRTTRHHA